MKRYMTWLPQAKINTPNSLHDKAKIIMISFNIAFLLLVVSAIAADEVSNGNNGSIRPPSQQFTSPTAVATTTIKSKREHSGKRDYFLRYQRRRQQKQVRSPRPNRTLGTTNTLQQKTFYPTTPLPPRLQPVNPPSLQQHSLDQYTFITGSTGFTCTPPKLMGMCTSPDPNNPIDECTVYVGEPCLNSESYVGEHCCLDDCGRKYCTIKGWRGPVPVPVPTTPSGVGVVGVVVNDDGADTTAAKTVMGNTAGESSGNNRENAMNNENGDNRDESNADNEVENVLNMSTPIPSPLPSEVPSVIMQSSSIPSEIISIHTNVPSMNPSPEEKEEEENGGMKTMSLFTLEEVANDDFPIFTDDHIILAESIEEGDNNASVSKNTHGVEDDV